ncbi:hypothetical protein [Synechocystis sp. PCC 7338]|uniref:hypothetical protein n=1 Tax=Synechocystis sp. PCC 7338 TaxID=2732530 RepID=UPI001BAFDD74|nr:hypothetical protein [Synechocystis sp. PCC 7338]QUS60553.1 hypothetical protein HTZ78_07620 [Synechocystis sp. PCC 7338]
MTSATLNSSGFNPSPSWGFEPKKVQRQAKNGGFDVERAYKITKSINALAKKVDTEWLSMPKQERDYLRDFAYAELNEDGQIPSSLFVKIRAVIQILWWKVNGKDEALFGIFDALHELIDNILDQLEREDPSWNSELEDSIISAKKEFPCLR